MTGTLLRNIGEKADRKILVKLTSGYCKCSSNRKIHLRNSCRFKGSYSMSGICVHFLTPLLSGFFIPRFMYCRYMTPLPHFCDIAKISSPVSKCPSFLTIFTSLISLYSYSFDVCKCELIVLYCKQPL